MKVTLIAVAAALLGGCAMSRARVAGPQYVDEFDLAAASCGFGRQVQAGKSVNGTPLTLKGKVYARGFGAMPEGAAVFEVNDKVTAFDALVGVDDSAKDAPKGYGRCACAFRVWKDDKIVFSCEKMLGEQPEAVHVELKGAKRVMLETRSPSMWRNVNGAFGDWADARFTCQDGAELEIVDDAAQFRQLGILTPAAPDRPRFNGADIWGVRPGHPVIFRVPVSGKRPMKFTAENLPSGVTLDEKGVLRGTAPAVKGDYDIRVTAENAFGKAARMIRLAVGDTIALTPPMGWNSWNVWCYGLTAERAKASARSMEESGLGDYGWSYINLDDWWEMNNSGCERVAMREKELGREDVVGPARDAKGRIIPNRSFPDMKGLSDYIHSFGFKAGLYSSPGPLTCGKCEASYGHEAEDATSWAEWGFDYIKYDWCSYNQIFKAETGLNSWHDERGKDSKYLADYQKPYVKMRDCLARQNRDILFSFCQYGMGGVQHWAREAGANCWRSWDDLKDGWAWMEAAIESRIDGEYWKYCGPGCWADPDMMIVGLQRSFGHDHPTFLTPNEQYTHVSIWAMVSSPLLTGCDLTRLDPFTRSLLVNNEVIAISQDRLGRPARRYLNTDAESVWVRELANGDLAVALVNRSPVARTIAFNLDRFGVNRRWKVRDCWSQTNEDVAIGSLVFDVPVHATKLVRLSPVTCSKCE